MEAFFYRLAIGAFLLFIIERITATLNNPEAAKIINLIALIGVVVFIVFGSFFHLS